jgi:predicted HTH transcriptional regulator
MDVFFMCRGGGLYHPATMTKISKNEIMISIENLHKQIASGEDSSRQFKTDVRNAESLASEMVAFANSEGRTLFIGVADDGSIPGLSSKDVSRINQLISNAASHLVRSPLASQSGVKSLSLTN